MGRKSCLVLCFYNTVRYVINFLFYDDCHQPIDFSMKLQNADIANSVIYEKIRWWGLNEVVSYQTKEHKWHVIIASVSYKQHKIISFAIPRDFWLIQKNIVRKDENCLKKMSGFSIPVTTILLHIGSLYTTFGKW